MWRFRTLRNSGIWHFSCAAFLALLCAFVASEPAWAQQTCYEWQVNGVMYPDANSACASLNGQPFSNGVGGTSQDTYQAVDVTQTRATCEHYSTQTCNAFNAQVNPQECWTNKDVGAGETLQATAVSCGPPGNPCQSRQGQSVDTVVESGPVQAGASVYDAVGCQMEIKSNPVNIVGCHGGCAVQTATYTGLQQSGSPTPQGQAGSNCVSGSAGTFCSEDQSGKNCGTVNGDEVCPQSIPPGTCVSFQSGGVACTMAAGATSVPTPPGPNSGTAGTPATPDAQVQAPVTNGGQTTQVTTNYYGSSVVQASTTGVATSSGGQNVGNGGSSGSGTGSGTVSVTPNAADGDCGASGVSCTGSVPASTWSGDCTDWDSCFQGFYTAVGNAPIVQGAAAIEGAWPAGSCDIGSVTMQTFHQAFDYGTTACEVWNNYIASPLSAILIACWAVVGIFIVLSA